MFGFCKPVSSKKRFLPFRQLNDEFAFTLFEKADSLPLKEWESITKKNTIFLEPSYLKIVERCLHTKLVCRYVIVCRNTKPCGIIYYQVSDFKASVFGDVLSKQDDLQKSKRINIFEKYIDSNKDETLMRLFTCGNNLVSGEYGYLFDEAVSTEKALALLLEITDVVSKEEKLRGTISAVLIKDFHAPIEPRKFLEREKYTLFQVEPNLVVQLPESINSLSEYTNLFSKKYRNRAKSIFKSFEGVEVKNMNLQEIVKHENEIYALYENIFDKAKFKLIKLPPNYFSSVKAIFPEKFNVKGFFIGKKLVAFASCFLMPDNSLEAHYIGFDYELNNQYNLYQNILYAMISEAIAGKCQKVNLGRTAAEIKTTVGARAEDLICYIKPQNTISKIIQKPFITALQPSKWTPRNPFKEEVAEVLQN
ncbi:MAG: hypothetical protein IT236_02515 [Bacteroidia bacterium]|nr:hypothetical protein [Bacteroidia bacterium]